MGPPVATTKAVAALLKKARAAEGRGALFEPKEGNAIALYHAALAGAPANVEAQVGLYRIRWALRDWPLAAAAPR